MKRLLAGLLGVALLGAVPSAALADCIVLPTPVTKFSWPGADYYSPFDLALLMKEFHVEEEAYPLADDFYVKVHGSWAWVVRIKGQVICLDPPIERDIYEAARRKVLPTSL